MDFLEEIEFFGFVPVTYVNNLIKNTTDRAEEILKDENSLTKKEIITALNKNFQIFEVFVLKSIFKFPDSFSFERKVTDFTCDTEINNLICELTGILEEEENLKKEIFIKEKDLELKMLEGKEYDILLESEEKMKKLTEKVKEMEKIHLEAESSLKKLNKLTSSLKRRNQLTEFKNLKDAFWEKEKGFLFENIPLAQIQFYNKNI